MKQFGPRLWLTLAALGVVALWQLWPSFERFIELNPNQLLLTTLSLLLVILFAGLVGVLVRNLVRLFVARKRGILGSRLQTKLVFFFLGLVLLPSTVLFIGSAKVINETVEALLRTPLENLSRQSGEVVSKWNDYFHGRTLRQARGIADEIAQRDLLAPSNRPELLATLERWRGEHALEWIGIYQSGRELERVLSPKLAADEPRRAEVEPKVDELVGRAEAGSGPIARLEHVGSTLVVHAALVSDGSPADRPPPRTMTVSVGALLPANLAGDLDGFAEATREYGKFRRHRRELVRLYLTSIALIFLATLLIATWIGIYLSRRITVPIRQMASATREISAGNLDVRVDATAGDEVGMLVDSFNEMAAELQENREVITRSTADLRRSNRALDERRRYIETLIANLSTGIVSLDPQGRVTTVNPSLCAILGVDLRAGDDARKAFCGAGLEPLAAMLVDADEQGGNQRRDLALERDGIALQVAVQVSCLNRGEGEGMGTLVMVEDLTDLARVQRAAAWREVAQRIAHEIKNPLTPIQLSAQRLRKKAEEDRDELVHVLPEATATIEREVGALKQLVDEFSRFARMPEVHPEVSDLRQVIDSVLKLYEGQEGVNWEVDVAPSLDRVRLDPQQMRRVLINLIDNSLAAMRRQGQVRIEAEPLGRHAIRLVVSDDGPGIPPGDKDKMFAPYFSTKRRGTGLGLAIVHKVVEDHQGTIRVEDNEPHGARFVIEIPA